jgi:branched-chain amino acid transport system ATP-binding protein
MSGRPLEVNVERAPSRRGELVPADRSGRRDRAGRRAVGPGAGLTLRGITVRFGGLAALDDVSLRVRPGAVVGVVGANGAGKTTLLDVVCGLVRPDAGWLTLDGDPLTARPHELSRLGIARTVPGLGLFGGLTLLENVLTGTPPDARAGFAAAAGLGRGGRTERRLRAEALAHLDELGVAVHAHRLPGAVPVPVRNRVAFARALMARPRLLLLDEPASGLGPDDLTELVRLVRDLPAQSCAVVLAEHHLDLAMAVCDDIVVLDFGRVLATGTPERIRRDPAVAAAFLGTPVPG